MVYVLWMAVMVLVSCGHGVVLGEFVGWSRDRLTDWIATAMLFRARRWELTAWARRDRGVWKPLLGRGVDGGVWDVVGLEGGRQPSTASWMAESRASAAVLR